ncbi:MAG: hypothetical protein ACXAE3_06645 [Candidatus Kariarchaeaceae archaeon]
MTIDIQFRKDVEWSIEYWTALLGEKISDLEYIYCKGSSIKAWDSKIDYVPMLSDVDIHLKTFSGERIESILDLHQALEISHTYEIEFKELYPNSLHTPRVQLIALDTERLDSFVPPLRRQIRLLKGDYSPSSHLSNEELRHIDKENLLETATYLPQLVDSVLDRIGIEFWSVLRRLTWRLSPAPVRLLNQDSDDPLDTWTWNRTQIVTELRNSGWSNIAETYSQFYLLGWDLFESGMQSSSIMRDMIQTAADCISQCADGLN